jgi:hypothetical protein
LTVGGTLCSLALSCGGTNTPGDTGNGGSSSNGGGTTQSNSSGSPTGSGSHSSGGSSSHASSNNSTGSGTSTGGSTSTGGGSTATTSTNSMPSTSCTITATSSTSTKIPTVGIVTWSTTLSGIQSASINFGLTTSYGMTAPVDLTQTSYRTLLLGMKQTKTYHYQIVASDGTHQCTSQDYTITAGARPNGLPTISVTTNDATKVSGGFLITGQYQGSAGTGCTGSPAYILDADSEIVWWYCGLSQVTGVVMSYDGTHMWINTANVPSGTATVHRVTMDGLTDNDYSTQLAGMNHQLTVLPDETVAFYAYNNTTMCDDIKEMSPSGTVKTIVNSQKAEGVTGACHVNNIQYSKSDDTYVFSDLDHNDITKIKRDGTTVWVLSGTNSSFTGDSWQGGEHGIHILAPDQYLIFNNQNSSGGGGLGGSGGGNGASTAIEEHLDLTAKTATKAWSNTANPKIGNQVMGDVQRLKNGNTIVAFSTQGVLHEVDSSGNVVQVLTWPLGGAFGYIQKRDSLYGPPPR